MAVSYSIPSFADSIPVSLQFVAAGLVFLLLSYVYTTLTAERPYPGFPVISLSERGLGPKASWFRYGKATVLKGLQKTTGPFQVITGTGPKIVVPNRFADELKNNEALNFNEAFAKDFFADYPGFEALRQGLHDDSLIQETVRVKLTQSLGLITGDPVEETVASVHDIFGENAQWHSTNIKQNVLDMVARLSSRVFLGKELCCNARWLQIAKDYTIDAFIAARLLRLVPSLIRPLAHWVMPNKLITPEVERRKKRAETALQAGLKPPKTADTIGWMYELARGRKVDYVAAQLSLTLAAIHTTTEAITQAIHDVCSHPELLQPLREEIVQVLGEEASMNRLVKSNVELSDGTILPAGARIMVAPKYTDPTVYAEPERFDAYRFLKEREKPGQNNSWQHVTTSSQHLAFGHGQHACPGRFFASNEMKIALAHLLLKYDWRFAGDDVPENMEFEGNTMTDPKANVELKRRQEEIGLDSNLA